MIIDLRCACREPLMRFLAPPFDVGAEFGLAVSLLAKGARQRSGGERSLFLRQDSSAISASRVARFV